jgi:ribosomal protein S18 acetylase RimI-like enzyme
VDIRDARPEEFGRIGELRVAAYRADGFLNERYADTLRALATDGTGEILAAVDDGDILGTVTLVTWPNSGEALRGAGEAEIRALAVAAQARGQGIGRALLAAVMRRATAREVHDLVLLSQPEMRAAQHLYTEAGFRRLPERDYEFTSGFVLLAFGLSLARRPGPADPGPPGANPAAGR